MESSIINLRARALHDASSEFLNGGKQRKEGSKQSTIDYNRHRQSVHAERVLGATSRSSSRMAKKNGSAKRDARKRRQAVQSAPAPLSAPERLDAYLHASEQCARPSPRIKKPSQPCLRDSVQMALDGYLQLEWQDFRKPPRLKKPLPPAAERVYTEAELKLIHAHMPAFAWSA